MLLSLLILFLCLLSFIISSSSSSYSYYYCYHHYHYVQGRNAYLRPTSVLRILDVRGFGSSRILIMRGGILTSVGEIFPAVLSQRILVRIVLVGRLGAPQRNVARDVTRCRATRACAKTPVTQVDRKGRSLHAYPRMHTRCRPRCRPRRMPRCSGHVCIAGVLARALDTGVAV